MKRYINVVAVQMDIEPLKNTNNIEKSIALMKECIKTNGSVDLFVLPEDFITGPIPNHLKTHCLHNNSNEINIFKSFAIKYKTHIVLGSFIKNVKNKFYNTTLVLNPEGKIILEHQKTKPAVVERNYITPGKNLNVVKTKIGTIGIINCWELADPLIARNLVKQGANILCTPSFWTKDDLPKSINKVSKTLDIDFINYVVPSLSFQFGTLCIFSNVAGEANIQLKTKQFRCGGAGQSQICIPIKGRVKHLTNPNEEGYIFYRYDKNIAQTYEKFTKLREDILLER